MDPPLSPPLSPLFSTPRGSPRNLSTRMSTGSPTSKRRRKNPQPTHRGQPAVDLTASVLTVKLERSGGDGHTSPSTATGKEKLHRGKGEDTKHAFAMDGFEEKKEYEMVDGTRVLVSILCRGGHSGGRSVFFRSYFFYFFVPEIAVFSAFFLPFRILDFFSVNFFSIPQNSSPGCLSWPAVPFGFSSVFFFRPSSV